MAPNADRPGEYRLAIRIVDAEIDPGDELGLEIYVVGYGKIRGSKISFHPPPYFIDPEGSKAVFDLKVEENVFVWGGREVEMSVAGFTFLMTGLSGGQWEEHTPYFDIYPHDEAGKNVVGIAMIATERKY